MVATTSSAETAGVGAGVTAIAMSESPGSTVALDSTLESLSRHVAGIPVVAIARANPQAAIARLAGMLC